MTEQAQTVVTEETTEPVARFARIKNALSKVEPVYVIAAATTVAAVVGMTLISRAEKKAAAMDPDRIVIDVEPEPEN